MSIRLILCDFDRTVTKSDVLDAITALSGNRTESSRIDKDYRNGKIDGVAALKKRFELIKGLSVQDIERQVLSKTRLTKGASSFFAFTKKTGIRTVILSGNINFVLQYFQNKLGFAEFYGSFLHVENDRVGDFEPSSDNKVKIAERLIAEGNYNESEIIAIGDSLADMEFMRLAKYRFLIHSKPVNADAVIVKSFDPILNFLNTYENS